MKKNRFFNILKLVVGLEKYLVLSASLLLTACGGGDNFGAAQDHDNGFVALPKLASYSLTSGMNFGTQTWVEGSTAAGGHGQPERNVTCLVNENYHAHTHLTLILNGVILAIPKNVGLQGCAYEVHTHDSSGIIHVETQSYHKITLGDFFAVWGKPLSINNIADFAGYKAKIFINEGGVLSKYDGDPAEIELLGHREITIVLGVSPENIPTFQWPSNL